MIDHETCSSLLSPFVRDELDEPRRAQVTEHLAGCPECRLEEAGLRALLAPVPSEDLSDLESARIRREVWAEIGSAEHTEPKRWAARIGPYLGAAAAVLIVAVGLTQVDLGGNDSDSGAGGGSEAAFDQDTSSSGEALEDRALESAKEESAAIQAAPEGSNDGGGDVSNSAGSSGAASGSATYAASPVFDGNRSRFTRSLLERIGTSEYPFTAFSQNYGAPEARDMERGFLKQLAAQAGGQESRVLSCGKLILDESADPALPAYAGVGSFDGADDRLVLGVATGADDLDSYSFWIFDAADCSAPIEVIEGSIDA